MGLLRVYIPDSFYSEIEYTVNCILSVFLGLRIDLIRSKEENVVIKSKGGEIEIRNHFFSGVVREMRYLDSYIPESVDEGVIMVDSNCHSIVSLFGSTALDFQDGRYVLDSDIISSTFFMLTRWEEYASPSRDSHNRFPARSSLAFRFGFLERPIVNEYIELLWDMLHSIGCNQARKPRKYTMVPTHDVDRPYLFNSFLENVRLFGGFIKRGDWKGLIEFSKYAWQGIDPWDTHDLFMDLSEKAGVQSYFFFLPKGGNKHDGRYDVNEPRLKALYKRITDRGHHIGLHPSYNAYSDSALFLAEKKELESAVGNDVTFGRQHYLRFEVPTTWKLWDAAGMVWDSTMSYADCAGFRCGVCYPFPVYDIVKRRQLDLIERPLIAMEGSLVGYEGLSVEDAKIKISVLKSKVKKYNGEFIFLYHNSSFFEGVYRGIGNDLLEAFYYP